MTRLLLILTAFALVAAFLATYAQTHAHFRDMTGACYSDHQIREWAPLIPGPTIQREVQ